MQENVYFFMLGIRFRRSKEALNPIYLLQAAVKRLKLPFLCRR